MAPDDGTRALGAGVSLGSAMISTAVSASLIYVTSSRRFAAKAQQLDNVAAHQSAEAVQQAEIETELLSISLATVTAAYFGVEALLNELFLADTLGMHANFGGLSRDTAQRLSAAWEAGAHKLSPLQKADMALVIAAVPPLDWGNKPCQSFSLLHNLRNELVHHKPKWTRHGVPGTETGDKLGGRLYDRFGEANIWLGRGAAYRWHGCLGGSCAQWAHESCVLFSQDVFGHLRIRLPWLTV